MNDSLNLEVENACDEMIGINFDLSIVSDALIASYLRSYYPSIGKDSLDEVTKAVKQLRKRRKGFQK